MTTSIPC